ncbi:MAG: ATP citrate lyase citrate-binding domain-containing protein [Candidatus Magasanikbacteria bacterium]|nr:ATP citrate lyase citrate-binding domain-containing protein [Candidatus Magasanikbacteria bacterium]
MNLYEFEGKNLLAKHGIKTPRGVVVRRGDDFVSKYNELVKLGIKDVVVKAQVLSGKRGKNNGIKFCDNGEEVKKACEELFTLNIRGQYVAAILIEEKLAIAEEHYISIVYDTNKKQPCLIYSKQGGMDIEDVAEEKIEKVWLDIREENVVGVETLHATSLPIDELWKLFLNEDTRQVEINPLVKTKSGEWVAADAKIAIDDDAFFRHPSASSGPSVTDWTKFEPRTMLGRLPTSREIAVKKIDEGEKYYQGTAGKYIELDGDIAMILNGGGASIANMDALAQVGLKAANYTEYSGNPPREKVAALARIVLSKPGLKGLWMCGVVANFTNIKETFLGICDALDEIKPTYPIVVRRDGTESAAGFALLEECAKRNNLNIKMFKKETGMSATAQILAEMIEK